MASAAILAYLPEIGELPHKKLAALVGVATFADDVVKGAAPDLFEAAEPPSGTLCTWRRWRPRDQILR